MRKQTKDKTRVCPKCGQYENQINARYNRSGTQRCFCKKPFFFSWVDDKVMFKEEYKMFCERYIKLHGQLPEESELDDTERNLMSLGADLQQIVWRRMKIANSDLDSFCQEFPSTPIEAFIMTNNNVFDSKLIQERLNYIHEVKAASKPKNLPSCALPWFDRGLVMYGWVKPKDRYYIGVDTGEGLGQDYSAIEVFNQDGVQVCEFKSNTIKPFQFAEIVHNMAIYYNRGYLVIEKASAGHTICDKLKNDYRYTNLHKHKEYDNRGNTKRKVGFVTNSNIRLPVVGLEVQNFAEK